jgi:hypothetical protein
MHHPLGAALLFPWFNLQYFIISCGSPVRTLQYRIEIAASQSSPMLLCFSQHSHPHPSRLT